MATTLTSSIESGAQQLAERLGLSSTPKAVGFGEVFENGVLATVRVSAERFGFTIRLEQLGVVPTREKAAKQTQAAIDAVLRGSQRASLLPKDHLWFIDENGARQPIPRPENSERQVRLLFPTRYDDSDAVKDKNDPSVTASTLWAIPLQGMTFVPEAAFDRWQADFERAKAGHLRTAELIVENYDRLRAASVRHYERIALDIYSRLLQTVPEVVEDTNALEFTRRWKRSVLRAWPSKEEILRNFAVDAKFYWVPLPSRVQEDFEQTRKAASESSASNAMRFAVSSTQRSQAHELTVGYVGTILERTEHVFFNFLETLNDSDRTPSPTQLNAVLKVVDMLKVMGSGVASFDAIRAQAEEIESLIARHKVSMDALKSVKGGKEKMRLSQSQLPSALAEAVFMVRAEAESLVGSEAIRTAYSDESPSDLVAAIWQVTPAMAVEVERGGASEDDDSDFLDSSVESLLASLDAYDGGFSFERSIASVED